MKIRITQLDGKLPNLALMGWWEEWEEREDDDGPHYRCTLCHDTGRVDLDDGYYQYLGDGTGMCPRCCGGVVVHDATERSGAQVPNAETQRASGEGDAR